MHVDPYQPTLSKYLNFRGKLVIFVAFNLHDLNYFLHGLNIHLIKIQPFVCHAFSLVSHVEILHNMYSLSMDSIIGRKLEMKKNVVFPLI
jgi:hypothetical protein